MRKRKMERNIRLSLLAVLSSTFQDEIILFGKLHKE
jgi:hypothetical protein